MRNIRSKRYDDKIPRADTYVRWDHTDINTRTTDLKVDGIFDDSFHPWCLLSWHNIDSLLVLNVWSLWLWFSSAVKYFDTVVLFHRAGVNSICQMTSWRWTNSKIATFLIIFYACQIKIVFSTVYFKYNLDLELTEKSPSKVFYEKNLSYD